MPSNQRIVPRQEEEVAMPSSAAHFNVLCGWNQTELSNKTREAHVAMPEYVRPPDQRKLSPKIRNSLINMV